MLDYGFQNCTRRVAMLLDSYGLAREFFNSLNLRPDYEDMQRTADDK